MRIPLLGGAYTARSVVANCQRCINYYPENNPKGAPVPVTYYQRPGLVKVIDPKALGFTSRGPVRGLYRTSQGNGIAVIGQDVFAIRGDYTMLFLGTLQGERTNPVVMTDNGLGLLLVDGSTHGYFSTFPDGPLQLIVDGTGTFNGATAIDIIDGFILWNFPGTKTFGSTLENSLLFDPLYTAVKNNYPDDLQRLIVNRHQVFLLGTLKSELWFNAGNPNFPFAELPGTMIEHGSIAPYSVATADIGTYWLGQDLQGNGIVFCLKGYEARRISNHALEVALRRAAAKPQAIGNADAIGYTYQQDGHVFYVLTLPIGNETWVWDEAVQEWHQRAWTDSDGNLNRDRTNCCAYINGQILVGDWQNGLIYKMDLDTYTDDGRPMSCIRTFPHITEGLDQATRQQLMESDGRQLQINSFRVDLDVGDVPLDAAGNPATISLRWSRDKGKTFGEAVLQSAGAPGQYLTAPRWGPIGVGRDPVIEISHSMVGPAALNGAWADVTVAKN